MSDAETRSRDARLWARNAVAELATAINEASQVLVTADDRVALGYVGNVRASMSKASEHLMRSKILLEGE